MRILGVLCLLVGVAAQAGEYQAMALRNFAIDGPALVKQHAKVDVVGAYIRAGNVSVLYEDATAAITGAPLRISLLTDDASHKIRALFLTCDTMYAGRQGCQVEIHGRATMCDISNVFGASHAEPCIKVEDGDAWSPPPPSAAEVERQKKAQEADEARQAQLAEQHAYEHQAGVRQCAAKLGGNPNIAAQVCESAIP